MNSIGVSRAEQQQRRQRPMPTRRRQQMRAQPACRIRNLIVVLQEVNEMPRRNITRRKTARAITLSIPLALKQVADIESPKSTPEASR